MKFCCALIPTRNSVENLRKTLRSFFGNANTPPDMEAVLKVDEDNRTTLCALPAFKQEFPTLKWVISPRGVGYNDMGRYIMEAAAASDSRWQFMLDDDAELLGKGWDTQLYEMGAGKEKLEFGAQAENYKLNHTNYPWGPVTPVGLFVPGNFWKDFGSGIVASPADECWQSILRQKGWPVLPLRGITYWHHHDINSPHRKDQAGDGAALPKGTVFP